LDITICGDSLQNAMSKLIPVLTEIGYTPRENNHCIFIMFKDKEGLKPIKVHLLRDWHISVEQTK